MKVKVTTEIDINLKMMFEATKEQHGRTYKDILEAGITEVLKQYDPVGALQARIEQRQHELQEDREQLARMRLLEPQQKRLLEFERKKQEQMTLVEDWVRQQPEKNIELIQKGKANWPVIAPQVGALNAAQAREWVLSVVRSWQAKHDDSAYGKEGTKITV